MTSAATIAVKIVTASTVTKTLRRALRARMYWLRSMDNSLEKRFFDNDDVVWHHLRDRVDVELDRAAIGGAAAQLDAVLAAAGRDAAAERDRLHDGHAGPYRVGTGVHDLAVDVEHRRGVDVDGVATLQLEVLGERIHLLRLAVADHGHGLVAAEADAAGRSDEVGQPRVRFLERIAARVH